MVPSDPLNSWFANRFDPLEPGQHRNRDLIRPLPLPAFQPIRIDAREHVRPVACWRLSLLAKSRKSARPVRSPAPIPSPLSPSQERSSPDTRCRFHFPESSNGLKLSLQTRIQEACLDVQLDFPSLPGRSLTFDCPILRIIVPDPLPSARLNCSVNLLEPSS